MRGTAWAAGAAAAAVALAAGCGTVQYRGAAANGHGAAGHGHGRATAAATPVPPTITRTQAGRLARALLSRAPLPGGARRSAGRPVRALSRPPSTDLATPSVVLHVLWTVAQPMTAVDTFLKKHVPAGMASSGSGQAGMANGVPERTKPPAMPPGGGVQPGNVGTVAEEFVSYQLSRLPAGVSTATLSMTVAPAGPGTSEVRADAQVIWFPPRSAAEYLPAGMHAVTITASYLSPKPGSVTKTFTSPATVRRVAAMLNGAHGSANIFLGCPMWQVSYRLAFARSQGASPYLVAVARGCWPLPITVQGHAQPALLAPAGLNATLASLMHVRTVPGTGVMTPVHPRCVKPPRGVWSGVPLHMVRKSSCLQLAPAAR